MGINFEDLEKRRRGGEVVQLFLYQCRDRAGAFRRERVTYLGNMGLGWACIMNANNATERIYEVDLFEDSKDLFRFLRVELPARQEAARAELKRLLEEEATLQQAWPGVMGEPWGAE